MEPLIMDAYDLSLLKKISGLGLFNLKVKLSIIFNNLKHFRRNRKYDPITFTSHNLLLKNLT